MDAKNTTQEIIVEETAKAKHTPGLYKKHKVCYIVSKKEAICINVKHADGRGKLMVGNDVLLVQG
jgi:hypothetical protein